MESLEFRKLTKTEEIAEVFSLYPDDWKEVLLPVWSNYAENSEVYVLLKEDDITTLGILFHNGAPEMEAFAETATLLFMERKPYIGFIYTLPNFRGRGFASLWLKELKNALPEKTFWLTVEDPKLITFYESNGFSLQDKSPVQEEWLLLTSQ
ncbi:GNAT family N-acetyltransferase [Robertkochia marina]|uniref:GNAT family N-acetyltransferase n=1 Tax=Robertkochia marina TaxID=1227945 RepID=A0A4S3M6E8_9FLAO|nr:GNAT family N-acetyltransferase [Robertkochia marina]THD69807.1 GNAT family N-acetyltransferase [Robertkochia marina]TRZ46849.1 GNAT family N-acetyltransferase [Robertkochia marina]